MRVHACVCVCVCKFTKFTGVTGFWTISCPNVCDPKHCVNCVDSEVCIVVSTVKTCVVMVTVYVMWEGSCSCWLVTVPLLLIMLEHSLSWSGALLM